MTRKIDGYVLRLKCSRCNHEFPHVVFSGDTDMVTMGLSSLTAPEANEVIIGELSIAEYKLGFDAGLQAFEQRISETLQRTDLRTVRLLRSEVEQPPKGISFQAFRQQYKPPRIFYSCAACMIGEATEVDKLDWQRFENAGGQITLFEGLELMVRA